MIKLINNTILNLSNDYKSYNLHPTLTFFGNDGLYLDFSKEQAKEIIKFLENKYDIKEDRVIEIKNINSIILNLFNPKEFDRFSLIYLKSIKNLSKNIDSINIDLHFYDMFSISRTNRIIILFKTNYLSSYSLRFYLINEEIDLFINVLKSKLI